MNYGVTLELPPLNSSGSVLRARLGSLSCIQRETFSRGLHFQQTIRAGCGFVLLGSRWRLGTQLVRYTEWGLRPVRVRITCFSEFIESYIGCSHHLLPTQSSSRTPHSSNMLNCHTGPYFVTVGYLVSIVLCASLPRAGANNTLYNPRSKDASVLILGGGVSGIIAARTLNENGITNFRIIEGRNELGGRLRSVPFGVSGKQKTVEVIPPPLSQLHRLTLVSQLGANWVQGTGGGPNQGPENPIWALVKKHGVETQYNAYYESLCASLS